MVCGIPPFQLLRRQNQSARPGCIHREDPLDFETHGIVAFARHRCEPQWVNLDFSSPRGVSNLKQTSLDAETAPLSPEAVLPD